MKRRPIVVAWLCAGVAAGALGCSKGAATSPGGGADLAGGQHAECASLLGGSGATSSWARFDGSGHLAYQAFGAHGDRILDYSYAGYHGGGVALPTLPVVATVQPSGGDDSAAIQAAFDAAAQRPLGDGVRGAVLLAAGVFHLANEIGIHASGVVLRGSGSGPGGTEIDLTGAPHNFLTISGSGAWAPAKSSAVITDAYVPTGALAVSVDDPSGLKPGDTVLVERPVTAEWVHFMGMDTLVRDGKPQTWLSTSTRIPADRVVAAVAGNRVTFDAPLSDSYDATYVHPAGTSGATVTRYDFPGRIAEVGVEHLRVVAPSLVPPPIDQPLFTLLQIDAVSDGWVRDVVALETENSVKLDTMVKRFTVEDLHISRSHAADGSQGYPLEVQYWGTQILVQRATIAGDNLYTYSTMARVSGPNVALNVSATGMHTRLEPHERWATGFLADNVVHDDRLDLVNRLTAGSGHGWAIGWGVLWNSKAGILDVEQPPGTTNWAIGSSGTAMGDGTFDEKGVPVLPASLYLAQLCERLGPQALANIGYPQH